MAETSRPRPPTRATRSLAATPARQGRYGRRCSGCWWSAPRWPRSACSLAWSLEGAGLRRPARSRRAPGQRPAFHAPEPAVSPAAGRPPRPAPDAAARAPRLAPQKGRPARAAVLWFRRERAASRPPTGRGRRGSTKLTTSSTRKTRNRTLAMVAARPARPRSPGSRRRSPGPQNIRAQPSMASSPRNEKGAADAATPLSQRGAWLEPFRLGRLLGGLARDGRTAPGRSPPSPSPAGRAW